MRGMIEEAGIYIFDDRGFFWCFNFCGFFWWVILRYDIYCERLFLNVFGICNQRVEIYIFYFAGL